MLLRYKHYRKQTDTEMEVVLSRIKLNHEPISKYYFTPYQKAYVDNYRIYQLPPAQGGFYPCNVDDIFSWYTEDRVKVFC